jgi:hypothetical protein
MRVHDLLVDHSEFNHQADLITDRASSYQFVLNPVRESLALKPPDYPGKQVSCLPKDSLTFLNICGASHVDDYGGYFPGYVVVHEV